MSVDIRCIYFAGLGLDGGAETWPTGLGLRSFSPPSKKSPWNMGISVCQELVLCLAQSHHIFSCGDSSCDWVVTLDRCSQGRCAASSMAWQRRLVKLLSVAMWHVWEGCLWSPGPWDKAHISVSITSLTWTRYETPPQLPKASIACVGRQSSAGKASVILQHELTAGGNRHILCWCKSPWPDWFQGQPRYWRCRKKFFRRSL